MVELIGTLRQQYFFTCVVRYRGRKRQKENYSLRRSAHSSACTDLRVHGR